MQTRCDVKPMKLRDHPLMIRKSGIASWPPQWQSVNRDRGSVQGEIGILDDVSMHEAIENKIFLAIEHLGERYIAILAFDDNQFAKQLYPVLLENLGQCLKEIGDLDLSHALEGVNENSSFLYGHPKAAHDPASDRKKT